MRQTLAIMMSSLLALSTLVSPSAYAQDGSWKTYRDARRQELNGDPWFHRVVFPFRYDLDYARAALGPSLVSPIGHGTATEGLGVGVRLRRTAFELSATVFEAPDGSTPGLFTAGLYSPVGPGLGKRPLGIRGIYTRPFMAGGLGLGLGGLTPYIAGGLSLQVPFVIVEARMTVASVEDGFGAYPEVAIHLDGLFNLIQPELQETGTYSYTTHDVTTSTRRTPVGSPGSGDYIETTTTYRIPEYHETTVYMRATPWWIGVAPRVSLFGAGPVSGAGLGAFARVGPLGVDLSAMRGTVQPVSWLGPSSLGDFMDTPTQLAGRVDQFEFSGELSGDLYRVIMALFAKNALSRLEPTDVQYSRFMLYIGYGANIPGDAQFDDEAAAIALIDAAFADGSERTRRTDPSQTGIDQMVKLGMGWELGPAQVRGLMTLSPGSGTRIGMEVAYLFPGKLLRPKR